MKNNMHTLPNLSLLIECSQREHIGKFTFFDNA